MLLSADSAERRTVKRGWSIAGRKGVGGEDASDTVVVDDTKAARVGAVEV